MSRRLIVDFRRRERVRLRLSIEPVRQTASHVFYRHSDGRTITVPHHPGRDLARPLAREILREIDLTPEQFRQEISHV